MNLLLIKNNLKEGLNLLERVSGENASLPILKNVLIETDDNKIKLSATNLEIATTCTISGKVLEAGKTTLPLNLLINLINNLQSERISLVEKNNSTQIQTDNYKATIQAVSAEEFPIIPKIKNTNQHLELNGGVLKESLGQVLASAQTSDLRPELASVLWDYSLDNLKLVTTDSFRLSEKTIPGNQIKNTTKGTFRILIPFRTSQELYRILKDEETVRVYHDPNQVLFETQRFQMISRLIEGNFPDYSAIVPEKFETEVTINRVELMNALKLAGVFSARVNEVRIKVSDKKTVEVFSTEQSVGENNYLLPARVQGANRELSFNWRYLLDGLKSLATEDVFWGVNEESKPALLKSPNDASYFYVLMPILKT